MKYAGKFVFYFDFVQFLLHYHVTIYFIVKQVKTSAINQCLGVYMTPLSKVSATHTYKVPEDLLRRFDLLKKCCPPPNRGPPPYWSPPKMKFNPAPLYIEWALFSLHCISFPIFCLLSTLMLLLCSFIEIAE